MLTSTQHKGIETSISAEGVHVVRIHYTADPAKDPVTTQGAIWLEQELQGYWGGMNDPEWRKEMEIDFKAGRSIMMPGTKQGG